MPCRKPRKRCREREEKRGVEEPMGGGDIFCGRGTEGGAQSNMGRREGGERLRGEETREEIRENQRKARGMEGGGGRDVRCALSENG